MTKSLEQLQKELDKLNDDIFVMECGDDSCYRTGRIDPLLTRRVDLYAEIHHAKEREAMNEYNAALYQTKLQNKAAAESEA